MAIQNYFNQSVQWSAQSGVNEYGDHSFGSATTLSCRIQLKKTIIRNESGEDIVADGIMYFDASQNVKVHDKILYTDATGAEKRFHIYDVYEAQGRGSLHHKKGILQYAAV